MASSYTINVLNKTGTNHAYMLFSENPDVNTSSPAPFTNAYLTTPIISGTDGSSTITLPRQFYAITGTSSNKIDTGVVITTSDPVLVQLARPDAPGTHCFVDTGDNHNQAVFDDSKTILDDSESASYEISTDSFPFPSSANIFVGLGGLDPVSNLIVPVATIAANPLYDYYISPIVTYYVSAGDFQAGEIIDVTQISSKVEIDFTDNPGSSYTKATVTHNNNGSWSLEFYS